jgi:predicted component of type VI protein secretion system
MLQYTSLVLRQNSGNVPTGTQYDIHVNVKESILRNVKNLGNDRNFQTNKLSHQFKQVHVGQVIGSIFDRALT